jgi:hypothetical protein
VCKRKKLNGKNKQNIIMEMKGEKPKNRVHKSILLNNLEGRVFYSKVFKERTKHCPYNFSSVLHYGKLLNESNKFILN